MTDGRIILIVMRMTKYLRQNIFNTHVVVILKWKTIIICWEFSLFKCFCYSESWQHI